MPQKPPDFIKLALEEKDQFLKVATGSADQPRAHVFLNFAAHFCSALLYALLAIAKALSAIANNQTIINERLAKIQEKVASIDDNTTQMAL